MYYAASKVATYSINKLRNKHIEHIYAYLYRLLNDTYFIK